ncbi:MAG: ATP-binding protein [bacterium]|nr:ATP-binding protein [bacterium]
MDNTINERLKLDMMGHWIDETWIPAHPDVEWITVWGSNSCTHSRVVDAFNKDHPLPHDTRFTGWEYDSCPLIPRITMLTYDGDPSYRTGTFRYQFRTPAPAGESAEATITEVLVMCSHYNDDGHLVTLACMPRAFVDVWVKFEDECSRLVRGLSPDSKVVIIGGSQSSFVPKTGWDEIILPPKLKTDILEDVESFFKKGVDVYKRLNLKPFRKLLLAGVPGTGKTMLCNALAKWALEREYVVIYISSADRTGATFGKIQQALNVAADSDNPTLILLEEIDAYLHAKEKALVLNVLDGSESFVNERGTLLIATTNYPEAIDERVLKRPGRLDRIFIIPETRDREEAEKMLRRYLGDMWQDAHAGVATKLVGYPGAFIREVALYALTQVAYEDLPELPLEMLERSFAGLKEQIDAKEEFFTRRAAKRIGFGSGLDRGDRDRDRDRDGESNGFKRLP